MGAAGSACCESLFSRERKGEEVVHIKTEVLKIDDGEAAEKPAGEKGITSEIKTNEGEAEKVPRNEVEDKIPAQSVEKSPNETESKPKSKPGPKVKPKPLYRPFEKDGQKTEPLLAVYAMIWSIQRLRHLSSTGTASWPFCSSIAITHPAKCNYKKTDKTITLNAAVLVQTLWWLGQQFGRIWLIPSALCAM